MEQPGELPFVAVCKVSDQSPLQIRGSRRLKVRGPDLDAQEVIFSAVSDVLISCVPVFVFAENLSSSYSTFHAAVHSKCMSTWGSVEGTTTSWRVVAKLRFSGPWLYLQG